MACHVAFDVELGVGLVQRPGLAWFRAVQDSLDWFLGWLGLGIAWAPTEAVGLLAGMCEWLE